MATPTPFSLSVPKPPTLQPFDPSTAGADPGAAFRLSQGSRALEHAAAARGTYFTPNTMRSLVDYNQNQATQDYNGQFTRALQTHTANQNTAQTGFNNDMTRYGAERNAWAADEAFKLSSAQMPAAPSGFSLRPSAPAQGYTPDYTQDRRAQENAALVTQQQQAVQAQMERDRQRQAQREAEDAAVRAQQQQAAQRDAQAHAAMAEAQKAAEAQRQQDAMAQAQRRDEANAMAQAQRNAELAAQQQQAQQRALIEQAQREAEQAAIVHAARQREEERLRKTDAKAFSLARPKGGTAAR